MLTGGAGAGKTVVAREICARLGKDERTLARECGFRLCFDAQVFPCTDFRLTTYLFLCRLIDRQHLDRLR